MGKTAFAVAVLIAFGLSALAWQDNSAQDAADYAARYGSCKAAR